MVSKGLILDYFHIGRMWCFSKGQIFDTFTLGGCDGLERIESQQFELWKESCFEINDWLTV